MTISLLVLIKEVITKTISQQEQIEGVQFIKELFPHKIVKEFDLVKSKIEARDNALHLDCCFQPIGPNKGIIYKSGFREEADYMYLVTFLEG
jgi:N-dimethylarginine dimethylaminohydrolase